MSFIQPDEHIVILDYNSRPGRAMRADELAGLADAGIKTIACYVDWDTVETAIGVYDWAGLDAEVGRIRGAGMKVIIKVYSRAPSFFHDDWYQRSADGTVQRMNGEPDENCDPVSWGTLSYWNPEAWAYHLGFIEKVCRRYSADDVLCINIAPANGESLVFGKGLFYDRFALASFREFVGGDRAMPIEDAIPGTPTLDWLRATVIPGQIETQRIFYKYGHEFWTQLHHAFETIPSTGNWLIDDLYTELHREFGDEHWGICYTVFREGETRGLWGPEQDIKRHGVKMLFASEGPAGLLKNTQRAIQMGARGMLTGPLAPYMGQVGLQDWMYSAIRTSNEWWAQ